MAIKYDNLGSTVSKTLIHLLLEFKVFIVAAMACIQTRSLDLSDPKE